MRKAKNFFLIFIVFKVVVAQKKRRTKGRGDRCERRMKGGMGRRRRSHKDFSFSFFSTL